MQVVAPPLSNLPFGSYSTSGKDFGSYLIRTESGETGRKGVLEAELLIRSPSKDLGLKVTVHVPEPALFPVRHDCHLSR